MQTKVSFPYSTFFSHKPESNVLGIVNTVKRLTVIGFAMSGIRLDKFTLTNYIALLFICLGYFSHSILEHMLAQTPSFGVVAWWYFVCLFLIRYAYLFASFIPKGIAYQLQSRYAEEKAYNLYEIGTSWMFFQRTLSIGLLMSTHSNSLLSLSLFSDPLWGMVFPLVGGGLILMSTFVNVWATYLIDIDTYFYKDLFVGRFLKEFSVSGPYRYFSNPMYGIGQAGSYGLALIFCSWEGIVASLLNQVAMYVFYFLIEKRHIQKIIGSHVHTHSLAFIP